MLFEERMLDTGHILYWQPALEYRINSNKILGFDLDWTLIKPIIGEIHPVDSNDWEFMNMDLSRIADKIKAGYKFVIFTNQGGLLNGSKLTLDGFKTRWYNIYARLQEYNINSVYLVVSLYDNLNRKPNIGMWEFVEKELNDNIIVDRCISMFVGDMAGRDTDFTDNDLLFAVNLGVIFEIPEIFYSK